MEAEARLFPLLKARLLASPLQQPETGTTCGSTCRLGSTRQTSDSSGRSCSARHRWPCDTPLDGGPRRQPRLTALHQRADRPSRDRRGGSGRRREPCLLDDLPGADDRTRVRQVPPPLRQSNFDQERAYRRLVELCSIGPRNHGSETKAKAEAWIQQVLREAGAEVTVEEFQHTRKNSTEASTFRNIVGRLNPAETRRIMIGTHYDTRSVADRDPDPARRNEPITGANDGGSGVVVLLEMAAAWKEKPPPVGVDLIFIRVSSATDAKNAIESLRRSPKAAAAPIVVIAAAADAAILEKEYRHDPRVSVTKALADDEQMNLVIETVMKRAAGQINVVIHTIGILLCLPHVLEPGDACCRSRWAQEIPGAPSTSRRIDASANSSSFIGKAVRKPFGGMVCSRTFTR